ncbi:TPR repeat-containing protein [Nostoc sp. HK-01]|nr:TPR repeat-containing protein [Nostoc sp. HK-01]
MTQSNSSFYQVGASLPVDAPSYVKRQADEEFYQKLQAGKLCYVLNSRQMGKSSLRVQTMQRLKAQGIACGVIDLTGIGRKVTLEQWYGGIVYALVESFHLENRFDFDWQTWWQQKRQSLDAVTCLRAFITEVLLVKIDQEIVIFIDEIDSVLSQDFSADDFFSLIRFFQNQRVDNPSLRRLTFALLGVATPSDLIRDKKQTPFNIGEAVELHGFQLAEVEPLVKGLEDKFRNGTSLLAEVLYWTGGQPFLTQKLCQLIRNTETEISDDGATQWVENLVKKHLIENWEAQDEPEHLRTIRDRLLNNKQRAGLLLGLYQNILTSQELQPKNSYEETELRLSGLIVKEQNKLKVYNHIYSTVFDANWIRQELAKLRPYDEFLNAWLASNRQDYSRLLQGKALQEALKWAEGKSLSDDDNQFLRVSRELDIEELRKANSATLKGLLGNKFSNPDIIIQEVLSWTGGQPVLSEKLGQLITNDKSVIIEDTEAAHIEELVKTHIIANWENTETAEFFKSIRSLLLRNKKLVPNILQLYQQLLQQGEIVEDNSEEQREILQSGLVIQQQNKLRIYNRIYASIFNLTWVNQVINDWRPFAPQFEIWMSTKDESYLLSGQSLQEALIWSESKSLTIEENEFLIVSQVLDTLKLLLIIPDDTEKNKLIAATTELARNVNKPQVFIPKIFYWTHGNISLTINLCNFIINNAIKGVEEFEEFIETQIIENWKNQDSLEDVWKIYNYLLIEQPHSFWTLEVYKQILQQEVIAVDDSLEQLELLSMRLVTKVQNQLKVANPIYESIFNKSWVKNCLKVLWPHAEAVIAWLASNCEDESKLLYGEDLQQALIFVRERNLSVQEHKFFAASQLLDIRKVRLALEKVEQEAIQVFQQFDKQSINSQGLLIDIEVKHRQAWQIASNWSQEIKNIKDREQEIEQQREGAINNMFLKEIKRKEEKQIFAKLIQNFPKLGLPVTIVTGFLGSGKSTFINEIIKNIVQKNVKIGVIVAEFGEIGIVSDIVFEHDSYNLYDNSTISNDLVDTVYKVLEREERIDYLIIETTGLADPLPIALTVLGTELKDLTRLDSIITVVDAANYSLDLFNSEVAYSQIAYGDIILLNKTDLVDEDTLSELERKIKDVKEGARIIRTQRSQVPLPLILNVDLFDSDKYFDIDDAFTSVFFQSDKPFAIRKFQYFLDNQLPITVFRAKGIMWFDESPKKHIFHWCGNRFTFDDEEWKDNPKNELLLIGRNLERQTLLVQLENCLCYPSITSNRKH